MARFNSRLSVSLNPRPRNSRSSSLGRKGKQSASSAKGNPSPAKALQPQPGQLSSRLHEHRVAGLAGGAILPPVPAG